MKRSSGCGPPIRSLTSGSPESTGQGVLAPACHERKPDGAKSGGLTLRSFALSAFPGYKGREIRLEVHSKGGMCLRSCWAGGSRDTFVVVRLADMKHVSIPENGSGFSAIDRRYGPAGLPLELPAPGFAIVEHSIFCGKDVGLRVHIHRDNAADLAPQDRPMLPAPKPAANEDYPCSDGGYEDACARACGL